jgi:MFS family permease
LVGRITSQHLMVGALATSMLCMLAIPFARSAALLGVILTFEGLAFGMYFTAGNAAIAEHTTQANRGIATGLFVMAGSIGTTLGPIGLGAAAERWSLEAVFWLTGAVLLAGLAVILYLQVQARKRERPPADSSGPSAGRLPSGGRETSVRVNHRTGASLKMKG